MPFHFAIIQICCLRFSSLFSGHCMTVSYWRELLNRGTAGDRKDPLSELGYRFSIQTDTNETSSPLKGLIQICFQKSE